MADVRECAWPGCTKRGLQVKHYRVDLAGGFLVADLCREHASPIQQVVDGLPAHHFTKIVGDHNRSRATTFQLTTIEDIERAKRPPRR